MRDAHKRIARMAKSRFPVLLLGETGTGKEVVARAIHNLEGRGPFVVVAGCYGCTSTRCHSHSSACSCCRSCSMPLAVGSNTTKSWPHTANPPKACWSSSRPVNSGSSRSKIGKANSWPSLRWSCSASSYASAAHRSRSRSQRRTPIRALERKRSGSPDSNPSALACDRDAEKSQRPVIVRAASGKRSAEHRCWRLEPPPRAKIATKEALPHNRPGLFPWRFPLLCACAVGNCVPMSTDREVDADCCVEPAHGSGPQADAFFSDCRERHRATNKEGSSKMTARRADPVSFGDTR